MTGGAAGGSSGAEGEWALNPNHRPRAGSYADMVAGIIDGADDVVAASSSLLDDGRVVDALLGASDRGARCYLLLASEARLKRDAGAELAEEGRQRHAQALGRLEDAALIRSSDEFHAKAVVADPLGDRPHGMIMTADLTREALALSEALFVELEGGEAKEAGLVMREALWERATHELAGGKPGRCAPLRKIKRVETNRILQGGSNTQLAARLAEVLDGNPERIVASSLGWDASHPVVERLCRLAGGGADVTVLARSGRPASLGALRKLQSAGARVVGFRRLHAKALVTESHAVVMSANIDSSGLGGFEMGIALEGERASRVRDEVRRWANNWEFELSDKPGQSGQA